MHTGCNVIASYSIHLTVYFCSSFDFKSSSMTSLPEARSVPPSTHLKSHCDCMASRNSPLSAKSSARILLPLRHCFGILNKNDHVETLHECTSSPQPSKLPFPHLVQRQCAVPRTPEHVKPAPPMAPKSSTMCLIQAHHNQFVSCDSRATPSGELSKVPSKHGIRSGSKQSDSRLP